METLSIVLMVLAILCWMYSIHLFKRRDNTISFLRGANSLCYDWSIKHIDDIVDKKEISAYKWAYEKLPSPTKIFFSFKPLKLESWLSKELVNKLKNN